MFGVISLGGTESERSIICDLSNDRVRTSYSVDERDERERRQ